MLSQTTNFSVTPNLSKKIPFAPRAIYKTGQILRDDRRLDVICSQRRDLWGK